MIRHLEREIVDAVETHDVGLIHEGDGDGDDDVLQREKCRVVREEWRRL